MRYWHIVVLSVCVALLIYINTGFGAWILTAIMSIPYGDKYSHLLVYGLCTLAMIRLCQYRAWQWGKVRVYYGSLLILVVAALEESSQGLFSHRQLELADFFANLLGIGLATCLMQCRRVT